MLDLFMDFDSINPIFLLPQKLAFADLLSPARHHIVMKKEQSEFDSSHIYNKSEEKPCP